MNTYRLGFKLGFVKRAFGYGGAIGAGLGGGTGHILATMLGGGDTGRMVGAGAGILAGGSIGGYIDYLNLKRAGKRQKKELELKEQEGTLTEQDIANLEVLKDLDSKQANFVDDFKEEMKEQKKDKWQRYGMFAGMIPGSFAGAHFAKSDDNCLSCGEHPGIDWKKLLGRLGGGLAGGIAGGYVGSTLGKLRQKSKKKGVKINEHI